MPTESDFVGEDRLVLVDGLVELFQELIALDVASTIWVSLAAPPGWGKTRVVHEFYARLAESQPEPKYWPPRIATSQHSDASVRRKLSRPGDFSHFPDSLPSFMWWGVTCATVNKFATDSVGAARQQWDVHTKYVRAAEPKRPLTQAGMDAFKIALFRGAAEFAKFQVPEEVPGPFQAAAAAAGGDLLGSAVAIPRQRKERNSFKKESLSNDDVIQVDESKYIADLVEMICDRAKQLPVVLFVEDLHLADAVACKVLDGIARSGEKVMIVTSAVPGADGGQEGINAELIETLKAAQAEDKCKFIQIDSGETLPQLFPQPDAWGNRELGDLGTEDLQSILLNSFPEGIDPQTLVRLTERYKNPFALELLGLIPKYQTNGPPLTLSQQEVNELPESIKAIYHELWVSLPVEIQMALALGARGAPAGRGDADTHYGRSNDWNWNIAASAADKLDLPDAAAAARGFGEPDQHSSWVRVVNKDLLRFHDLTQVTTARSNYGLFPDDAASQALVEIVNKADLRKLRDDDETAVHFADLTVALFFEGLLKDTEQLAKAALVVLRSLQGQPFERRYRVSLADYVIQAAAVGDGETVLEIRSERAICYLQNGEFKKGLKEFEAILKLQTNAGVSATKILQTRSIVATAQMGAGETGAALKEFQAILEIRMQANESGSDPEVIKARYNVATCFCLQGELRKGLKEFEAILELQREANESGPVVLKTRHSLAVCYGHDGQIDEAIREFEAIAEALPEGDPDLSEIRRSLGECYFEAERWDESLSAYQSFFEGFPLLLPGDLHADPLYISERRKLAYCYGNTGQVLEAIKEFEAIVEALPEGDPVLSGIRLGLAVEYCRSEDWEKAATEFNAILKQTKHDGPDLTYTYSNIAQQTVQKAHRVQDIEGWTIQGTKDELQQLQRDDPSNPDIFDICFQLGCCHLTNGDYRLAAAVFSELGINRESLSSHPWFSAIRLLAVCYEMDGRWGNPINVYEELLRELIDAQADRSLILEIRKNLAECYLRVDSQQKTFADSREKAFLEFALLLREMADSDPDNPEIFVLLKVLEDCYNDSQVEGDFCQHLSACLAVSV